MTRFKLRIIGILVAGAILPACGVSGGGTLTPTVAPAIPAEVTATPGNKRATIHWSSPSTGATFTVKRSLTSGGPYFPVTGGQSPSPTSLVDLGLDNGTIYYYVVSAANQYGSSTDSAEVQVSPGFKPSSIASGPAASHSFAILPDRSLWAWGANSRGQLGNGFSTGQSSSPIEVQALGDVTAAAAGENFSLALTKDGTLWAWGENSKGVLGNGTTMPTIQPLPQKVPGVNGVVAFSAGGAHVLALMNDGRVWSWGDNSSGQLGNGTWGGYSPTPTPIAGLSNVKSISAGAQHCLAVLQDGTVWAWGFNSDGQLGTGIGTSSAMSPVQVPNMTSFVSVAVGSTHSLALRSDGSVWAWGNNQSGQAGNGVASTTKVASPAKISSLVEIRAIAAGFGHCYALQSNGTVWSWGNCVWAQLGNGSTTGYSASPVKVLNADNVTAMCSGLGHGLCLEENGTVRGWGLNGSGNVGNGTAWTHDIPVQVPNITGIVSVGAGMCSTTAARNDGTVWAWGLNNHGEVGFGGLSYTNILSPGQVPGISKVSAVAMGAIHTLALKTDGTVWGWGYNQNGELGQGAPSADVTAPVQVPGLANIKAIAAARDAGLALQDDGTVRQWGTLYYTPTTPAILSPSAVPGLTGVTAISGGSSHALALKDDGTVWGWGANNLGQLGGANTMTPVVTPVQIQGISGVIAIAAGYEFSLAVTGDGAVWAWGRDTGTYGTPSIVEGISGATSAWGAFHFSLVVDTGGKVWSWGANDDGQLGTGDESYRSQPVATLLTSGVVQVTSGDSFSVARMSDGTLQAWGRNVEGQLGVPILNTVPVPVPVIP